MICEPDTYVCIAPSGGRVVLPWPGTVPAMRQRQLDAALESGVLTKHQHAAMSICVTDIANADPIAWAEFVKTFEKER